MIARGCAAALAVLLALVVGVVPAGAQGSAPPAPGSTFRDCPQCPEMVVAAPGSFLLGQAPGQRIAILHRFAYSRDKVSAGDWKHCVLAGQCSSLGAVGTAGTAPIVQVSWIDVQQYVQWLTLETGVEYRLLSEAEWEYLARRPGSLRAEGLEWVSDCWHADLAGAPADGSSWDSDGDCRYHVARGHRTGDGAPSVTRRYRFLFSARDTNLGFRVARTLRD